MTRVVLHDGIVPRSEGTACTLAEGKTRQSDAKAADVNAIVARFDFDALNKEFQGRLDRGEAPWLGVDVSEVPSFQDAISLVRRTEDYFRRLPAEVRSQFRNDPAVLVDAFNARAPEFLEAFRKIGLLGPDEAAAAGAAEAAVEARAAARAEERAKAIRLAAAAKPPVAQ